MKPRIVSVKEREREKGVEPTRETHGFIFEYKPVAKE